jgi:hypothetical protein
MVAPWRTRGDGTAVEPGVPFELVAVCPDSSDRPWGVWATPQGWAAAPGLPPCPCGCTLAARQAAPAAARQAPPRWVGAGHP